MGGTSGENFRRNAGNCWHRSPFQRGKAISRPQVPEQVQSRVQQLVERCSELRLGHGLVPHEMLEVFPGGGLVEQPLWRKHVTEYFVLGVLGAEQAQRDHVVDLDVGVEAELDGMVIVAGASKREEGTGRGAKHEAVEQLVLYRLVQSQARVIPTPAGDGQCLASEVLEGFSQCSQRQIHFRDDYGVVGLVVVVQVEAEDIVLIGAEVSAYVALLHDVHLKQLIHPVVRNVDYFVFMQQTRARQFSIFQGGAVG